MSVPNFLRDLRIFYAGVHRRNKNSQALYVTIPIEVIRYMEIAADDEIGIAIWKTGKKLPKGKRGYMHALKKMLDEEISLDDKKDNSKPDNDKLQAQDLFEGESWLDTESDD